MNMFVMVSLAVTAGISLLTLLTCLVLIFLGENKRD